MNELKEIITEYEKMSKKNHPNLLALRGYSYLQVNGEIRRIAWIMDIKSGDLVDMINGTGIFLNDPLSEKERFLVSIDLVQGLEALHKDPPIVHNNIQPANCLYEQRAKVCLGDFGSAKYTDPKKTLQYFSFM